MTKPSLANHLSESLEAIQRIAESRASDITEETEKSRLRIKTILSDALEADSGKVFRNCLATWGVSVHAWNYAQGFWGSDNPGEKIALMHSELSEMLEGIRKPGPSEHCPELSAEEEEAADLLIRLLDFCEGRNIRLGYAFSLKMAYNLTRPRMHGKKF